MAKIGLPKGSGKWLKVREKSGNFEMDIEWQPCQQCGILTSVDSDEPLQHYFKLRNSKWCSISSFTIIEYSSD